MVTGSHIFSSESVTEGHPDKICDQVSDSVLDAILTDDPTGRVACETLTATGLVVVAGEISTSAFIDVPSIVRETLQRIGYTDAALGLDADNCAVMVALGRQSADIAQGVDTGGAGDQGMMFGYACNETPELMPMPITIAHHLTYRLSVVRKDGTLPWLGPDGKSQVSIEYRDGVPRAVKTVVVSTQHADTVGNEEIQDGVAKHVINPVLKEYGLDSENVKMLINPTGRFVVGGPKGDAGLTGRKIIVDTYGGLARHGGGAFSGKDPTKVDRSAAYASRWVAKNVVAAGLADRCEVQLAYAIGVAEPVSIMVDTFGTGKVPNQVLEQAVSEVFDLTPAGIIESLKLRRPMYRATAAYGHFGRTTREENGVDLFTWESTSRSADVAEAAKQVA